MVCVPDDKLCPSCMSFLSFLVVYLIYYDRLQRIQLNLHLSFICRYVYLFHCFKKTWCRIFALISLTVNRV